MRVYYGDMLDSEKRKLINRLHRIEGQVRSLERQLSDMDNLSVIGQFDATISALKGCLSEYIALALKDDLSEERKAKIIARLISNR